MSRARTVGIAAASAGGVAAAAGAGLLARRRSAVRNRDEAIRRDAGRPVPFGSIRSDRIEVATTDGIVLHAEVDEPEKEPAPGTPTVVLVHGYALSMNCWHFQRDHLRRTHRVVLYDQRSHGRSDRSTKGHATIEQLACDLESVLDALVPEGPVVLVGHSMGGMTVIALAERRPDLFGDRVVGVGLLSTTAGGLRTHRVFSKYLPDRVMGEVTPRTMALLARFPGLVDGARRTGSAVGFLATQRFAFGGKVPASYVEFVDDMLRDTPFEVLAEFFPNFDVFDLFDALHAFETVPTTILGGTSDVLTSIGHSRKMASRITGSELVEIDGGGHMALLEYYQQVNAALDRLVQRGTDHAARARRSGRSGRVGRAGRAAGSSSGRARRPGPGRRRAG